MDFLSSFGGGVYGLLGYLVPFLFVLTIVVFFHELGHFLVARWRGVGVTTFSVGFGRELFGWTDSKGTRWRFSLIPLGGYVKFADDDDVTSSAAHPDAGAMSPEQRARSFHLKPVRDRAAIVAAGPIANFILAIVIFTVLFATVGRPITEARVDSVAENSAAAEAGIAPGDVILSIDGKPIESFSDLQRIVTFAPGEELTIIVRRSGENVTVNATPRYEEVIDQFGNRQKVGLLGISRNADPGSSRMEKASWPGAFVLGVEETWFVVSRSMEYLYQIVVGKQDADQLGGPVRIAQVSGQVAAIGFVALINLAAFLSVSIGMINLFPIPMLDGGHLMYYAIEAVRGRPLSERAQEVGMRIGLTLVLMLMMFATWNDLARLPIFGGTG